MAKKRGPITDPKVLERLRLAREKGLATRRKNAAMKKEKRLLAQMQAKKESMRVKEELSKALTETKSEPKPEVKPEPKAEPKPEPKAEPKPKPKPEVTPAPEPDPIEVKPKPLPQSDPKAGLSRPVLYRDPPPRKLTRREQRQSKFNDNVSRLVQKYMY